MFTLTQPKIELVEQAEDTYGKIVAEPLEPGFGVTLGNSLRRILLSSLPGAAVTSVRIEGVHHEYSTIPQMREDVIDFILNVKGIRFKAKSDQPSLLKLEALGEGRITAADIQPSADYDIANPEWPLATLDSEEARLSVEFQVERGRGYNQASTQDGLTIGTLPVDAIFTPVKKVSYSVERARVEQRTDYDKLVLEVWTDGTILPLEAVRQAAQILVDQFFLFCALGKTVEAAAEKQPLALTVPAEHYNITVEKLGLSARTLNCLKRSNINRVGEVLEKSREDLLQIRNFGEKSLVELYAKLEDMGLLAAEALKPESATTEEGKSEKPESTRITSLVELREHLKIEQEDQETEAGEEVAGELEEVAEKLGEPVDELVEGDDEELKEDEEEVKE